MKLNDELYEIGKNSKGIFTEIDEDYGLVCKSMPVTDEELEQYIYAITRAKADGINIAGIVDYRFIPGSTSTFKTNHGVISYTKGVFLEDRAKGKCLEAKNFYVSSRSSYDYNKLILDYLKAHLSYIEELERRAEASQEVFDKLVRDCLALTDYDLMIDPKPLNFFFHPEHGFTIIDVIKKPEAQNKVIDEYMGSYMYSIVMGYGQPNMYVDNVKFNGLPKEYQDRLYAAYRVLNNKIITALRNNGFSDDLIGSTSNREGYRIINAYNDVNFEDMETELYSLVESSKVKDKTDEMVDINKLVINS